MRDTTSVDLPTGEIVLQISASTDRGSIRAINEDSFIAQSPLFVVADGMGGHERGDQASQTAVAVLGELVTSAALPTATEVLDAIGRANHAVVALSEGNEGAGISGTTLAGVGLVLAEDAQSAHWMAFNIGDSRIYTWDGRSLLQLSVDHSAVQELVDAGLLTEDGARSHPDRNVITRALGARNDVDADIWLLPVARVHSFLVCSDGLTKELDDAEIARVLSSYTNESGGTVADSLVEAALLAGGNDNVTVVYLETVSAEAPSVSTRTSQRLLGEAVFEDTAPRI